MVPTIGTLEVLWPGDRDQRRRLEPERVPPTAVRALAYLNGVRCGSALQALGYRHGPADGGLFLGGRVGRATNDLPGVHADAKREPHVVSPFELFVFLRHRLEHGESGAEPAYSAVVAFEYCSDGIPDVLIDGAADAMDLVGKSVEIPAEDRAKLLRIEALAQRRRP